MQTSIPGLYAVGDGAGLGGYRLALLEGQVAGRAAAKNLSQELVEKALHRERAFHQLYAAMFTPGPGIYALARPDTLVCRCEGVTQQRLEHAIESGAATMSEVKALTRCGMGPCQGRVCGQHVLHTIARLTGRSPEKIGSNSARPPVFPLSLREIGRG